MKIIDNTDGYKIVDVVCFSLVKQTNFMKDELERLKSSFSGNENAFQERILDDLVTEAKARLYKKVSGNYVLSDINFVCDIKEIKKDVTFVVTIQAKILEKK